MYLNFKVRDFATYVALEANGQGEAFCHNFHHRQTFHHLIFFIKNLSGENGALALEAFHRKSNNSSIGQWCKMH